MPGAEPGEPAGGGCDRRAEPRHRRADQGQPRARARGLQAFRRQGAVADRARHRPRRIMRARSPMSPRPRRRSRRRARTCPATRPTCPRAPSMHRLPASCCRARSSPARRSPPRSTSRPCSRSPQDLSSMKLQVKVDEADVGQVHPGARRPSLSMPIPTGPSRRPSPGSISAPMRHRSSTAPAPPRRRRPTSSPTARSCGRQSRRTAQAGNDRDRQHRHRIGKNVLLSQCGASLQPRAGAKKRRNVRARAGRSRRMPTTRAAPGSRSGWSARTASRRRSRSSSARPTAA